VSTAAGAREKSRPAGHDGGYAPKPRGIAARPSVTMGATPPNPEGSLRVPPSRWGLRPQTPRDRCASLRHDGGYAPKPRGIAARPSVTMGATPPNPEGSLRVPPSRWG